MWSFDYNLKFKVEVLYFAIIVHIAYYTGVCPAVADTFTDTRPVIHQHDHTENITEGNTGRVSTAKHKILQVYTLYSNH